MITRDNTPRSVMVIADFPLVNEEKRGLAFSEASSTAFKDALGTASHLECKNSEEKHILNSSTICYTYLSLSRCLDGDADWAVSVVSKKKIPEGETYYQIPWLKDVWVSAKVQISLNSLIQQIKDVQPKMIICAGKWTFMFLASLYNEPTKQLSTIAGTKSTLKSKKMFGGLNTFRSSILTLHEAIGIPNTLLIPVLTPSYLFLVKDKEFVVKRDYAKIAFLHRRLSSGIDVASLLQSKRNARLGLFKIDVIKYLQELLTKLELGPLSVAFDIETRQGYKDCIGIAYSEYESLTIPFSEMYEEINENPHALAWTTKNKQRQLLPAPVGTVLTKFRSYWSIDDEIEICNLLWKVMLHPNCKHVGQNYNYDCQYYFHQWKLRISSDCDTMILHHVLHNTLQKDLAMLASIYCMDYVYWKDEIEIKDNFTRWIYNGKDCQYTLTIANILKRLMARQDGNLQEFYNFQQYECSPAIVTLMNRGVNIDNEQKEELRLQFTALMEGCIEKINYIFMEEVNLNSTPQVKRAFKELLGIKPILNRKSKAESFGSDAMLVYLELYPEWRTLLTLFLEYKSIKVFVRNFLSAKLDSDGYMRCDYNPAGTKTYRLSSRKNVFGNATNLANIPSKGKIDLRIALQEIPRDDEGNGRAYAISDEVEDSQSELAVIGNSAATIYEGTVKLPNVKQIFLPDSLDWVFFDGDYSAGDLHFVTWEADCIFLKAALRAGKDPYSILASEYYQREITKADEERQIFKAICHGLNYLGQAPTLAAKAGLKVSQVKKVQGVYFKLCPEIPEWHMRLEADARAHRFIRNIWGCKNEIWDFNDPMWMNKAVAWVPQSSLAVLVNKALVKLEKTEAERVRKNVDIDLSTNIIAAKRQAIETKLQTHDSLSGQFLKADFGAVHRIKSYMEYPIPYADPLTIPAEIKISPKSYGDCMGIKKLAEKDEFYLNYLQQPKELVYAS